MSSTANITATTSGDSWEFLSLADSELSHQAWLELQCSMVAGSYSAMLVLLGEDGKSFQPVSLWPGDAPHLDQLSDLVEHVIDDASGYVAALPSTDEGGDDAYGVAYPILRQGQLYGVVAVALRVANEQHLQRAMRQLQWGSSWVELFSLRSQSYRQNDAHKRLTAGVEVLAKVLAEQKSAAAAMRLVTELSVLFNCERVSIGYDKKGSIYVDQMSHSAQFGKRMNIIRAIEAAMNESVDQRGVLLYPMPDNAKGVVVAHKTLAEILSDVSIMTIPVFDGAQIMGVVTLERDAELPFSQGDADYCESMTNLAITALAAKRENDKAIFWKIVDVIRLHASRFVGRGYPGRKIIALAVLAFLLFASLVNGTYRLSANATLESVVQRVVVAPYDGFIKDAPLRAGDVVNAGDLIAALDDKDLRLERLKWLSQTAQLKGQSLEATAGHDRVKLMVVEAQLEQGRAQLELVESQLQRAEMRAPFNGIIVSGDMTQRLGGAVKQGEVLFEVSPLNAYRINMQVKESRIADVKKGMTGVLHLSALPDIPFHFSVNMLTPLTSVEEGASYFRVEAYLYDYNEKLRPGMEGVGKIEIDQRRLISIWTRELMEWLRLKLWSWWS